MWRRSLALLASLGGIQARCHYLKAGYPIASHATLLFEFPNKFQFIPVVNPNRVKF